MPIYETFSKRKKRLERAGKQDIYQYDKLPPEFRVQIIHIWRGAIGRYYSPSNSFGGPASPANVFWEVIHKTLARELGLFALGEPMTDPNVQCQQYLLKADTSGALDIIELSFRVIERMVKKRQSELHGAEINQDADSVVEELNHRFQEHGIGYQYVAGELVRIDSQLMHAEAVKPALSLLHEFGFDGPAEEFIQGFEHYRHGRNKEAIAEALKSFESTMKAICRARNWTFPANATAKPLMDILFTKGLIPADLESHFSGLRSAMESGLPTISNRRGRHGQGSDPIEIPPHFAAYALHLAASNIVFLVHAHKSLE
jgi:hypothetical protein